MRLDEGGATWQGGGGGQMSQTFTYGVGWTTSYSNTEYIQSFSSEGEMKSSPICFNSIQFKKKIRFKLDINELL
jgi:hypothetical protein